MWNFFTFDRQKKKKKSGKSPFRFENMWLKAEGFTPS